MAEETRDKVGTRNETKSRKVFLEAFFEGIEAGRIVEVESTTPDGGKVR